MTSRGLRVAVFVIGACLLCLPATSNAQGMEGYSVYADVWREDGYIYANSSIEDNSEPGACTHSSYYSTTTITDQFYTDWSSSPWSGFSSEMWMTPDTDTEGAGYVSSRLDFHCTCGGDLYFGAPSALPFFYHVTYYTDVTRYEEPVVACVFYAYACTSGGAYCGHLTNGPYTQTYPPWNPCPEFVRVNWIRKYGTLCFGEPLARNEGGACY